jgi:mono/diheme cytochrome c family protein
MLGCTYTKFKGSSGDENLKFSLPQEKISELSYAVVNQKIFVSKCISCHGNSGNISLESYADVVRNISLVEKSVFLEKTMPKKNSLSDEELSYLWNWIKLGVPEQSQNRNPEPAPVPVLPAYESINKNVFMTSCIDCHKPSGSGKRILLDKDSLLNSPLELVIPGNPDESGLVVALERIDDKRMPPVKEGYTELKEEVKTAIRKWIENGAKE